MITLNFSADISKEDEKEIREYCQQEFCATLERKLEGVTMDWLDKAKTHARDVAETKAMMKAKTDAGITDLVPKPGDKIEVTEMVEIPKVKLTKDEMKQRVLAWIENIKADQRKIDTGLKFKPAVSTDDEIDALYRFVVLPTNDFDRIDGAEAFEFRFDGMLYEIIEYYRSDGFWKEYGEAFDALTEGTNWIQESERPGVEYFVEEI